ncbi:MAG: deoxyribodipyrimidine photo-lyase [Gemmatimonas sp.]|jgi:deoxyribodipyrimidine photo-lyase|uniref:deoxyribodipyrimidine photo-lyase n=2 Tax=Gemmatimonas sp. TaxID=1962908 RepID=UPI00391F3A85|nr:deoxyribodipyrimidine photo-lyase [Gemmatimonadota bacterium]
MDSASAPLAAAPHRLGSEYVRDQLVARTVDVNGKTYRPDGEYVLYWMQSTHRLEENWGLRAAIRTANRVNLPLVIHQGLDPTYPFAADRHHTMILQGARDTARHAEQSGLHYQFVLRRRRDDDRRVVDRLAARAYVVVTDLFPTAGIRDRVARLAERVTCRVLAIDSVCTVPSGAFTKAEFAARTIRPKIAKLLDHALEPVAEDMPRVPVSEALRASLRATIAEGGGLAPLPLPDMSDEAIAGEVAACEIDHAVGPVTSVPGGTEAGLARLSAFLRDDLPSYAERRNEASDGHGTSGLSPYLHYGMIPSARVVRDARARGVSAESLDAFVQQVTTWRELSFNWCVRTPGFDQLASLPAWVQRTMAEHADDPRPAWYALDALEAGRTDDRLWNAAQHELVTQGIIHNYPRMLWGKTVLLWTTSYEQARAWLFHLNDKYALDGRDPNSVGGIMWCLGLWDRPWGNKPVWGGIRPMVTSRAKLKFDVEGYVARVRGTRLL